MGAFIKHVTIDCADPYELAGFWSELTGWPRSDEDLPGDPEASLVAPDGVTSLWFQQVPEAKSGKNRVHLDLAPSERTRDEEVKRIRGLGASVVADHRRRDGTAGS